MTDYRRFLAVPVEEVWPYFGGPYVETGRRRLRIGAAAAPGFWWMSVSGRTATPVRPAEQPDLSHLPAVRGFSLDGYVVTAGGVAARLSLPPADEPLAFAPMVARRWPSGELIFDALDFESGVEDEVREAFAQRRPLVGIAGVPAPLRAAFAYAVVRRAGVELGIPVRPVEARASIGELAAEGDAAARTLLERLRQQRLAAPAALRPTESRPEWMVARDAAQQRSGDPLVRVANALDRTGAALREVRSLSGGLEIRYDFLGERFVSLVDADTLQVVDAGICLAGADRRVTLESLPGVIREAIDTGELNITAW